MRLKNQSMNPSTKRITTVMFVTGTALLCAPLASHAYLGGFEPGDGYQAFLNEVTGYNAGQYGLNNGGPGGAPFAITPGTGLWYGISGIRYPAFSTLGTTSYATGHQGFDRTAPSTNAQALVITTNSEGWGGPTLKYGYKLDSRDLNGVAPAATANSTVNVKFWWCPRIQGTGEGGGLGAGTIGDTIEFVDSLGNVGLTLGAIQPGTTTDFVGYKNGASFVNTGVTAFNSGYSQWDLTFDLTAQTVSANYFDGGTNTGYSFFSSVALATNLLDLTELRFASTAGVNNAKNFALDDFEYDVHKQDPGRVPEPGAVATLFSLGVAGTMLARRRTNRERCKTHETSTTVSGYVLYPE